MRRVLQGDKQNFKNRGCQKEMKKEGEFKSKRSSEPFPRYSARLSLRPIKKSNLAELVNRQTFSFNLSLHDKPPAK